MDIVQLFLYLLQLFGHGLSPSLRIEPEESVVERKALATCRYSLV